MDEKSDADTVTYEIHPSIGIARLGNSDAYFIGPEPVTDRCTKYCLVR
nr:LodA/GoxA family CTQ-dependent oxidase [Caballeronia calidae]